MMARRGVWLTPTLVAYAAMADAKYAGFLPPESAEKNAQVLERGLESLTVASRAGVRPCYGSDLLGPLAAEELGEFAIRRRVLSDLDILRAATVNPAEMLEQGQFLGRVDQGFAADLLVVTENPLEDVTVFDRPEKCLLAVVKDGRVWESRWSELPVDVEEPAQLIE
jgi:imidazolonepropionase-like amidohydrolase